MACYHPIHAYRLVNGSVVFVERGDVHYDLWLPCGNCVGCRLERSRQWAVRCIHEAQMHDRNCFITLTYKDMPEGASLNHRDFQLFMKRLRKATGQKIRYFMCGEYGENLSRPHFHACLFGYDFPAFDKDGNPDKTLWKNTSSGSPLYRSRLLERLWTDGFSTIGDVTFESAAYVARYVMKKVNGDARIKDSHYEFVDNDTGEILRREPEYCRMSLKPGIGSAWIKRFKSDVYPSDQVVVQGRPSKPPRFYDKKLKVVDPDTFDDVVFRREKEGRKRFEDQTDERLAVREQVATARLSLKRRSL